MKTLQTILVILALTFIVSCSPDDDNNTATRSADKIEIFIDGSLTPIQYSTNILAKDYSTAATSGFNCVFQISSKDSSNNRFVLNFAPSTSCPTTIATPVFVDLIGTQINALTIQGVDINYADSRNFITINYTVFGSNIGDAIKIDFNGKYYDSLGNMHRIIGIIDVTRA